MCGRDKDKVALEVDHVTAVADGGTDELHNLATLCRDCNRGKSAYRFTDYRSVSVTPEDLSNDFRFFQDDRTGDFVRFHLYVYFKNGIHPGSHDDKFQHAWTVSGTEYDISSDKAALVARRRSEQEAKFLTNIKQGLIAERKRLVRNEEGLCKVDG